MSKKPDVNTESSGYQAMLPDLELIGALMGGTRAMREAGHKYLPQYEEEHDRNYQHRLERAVLTNFFMRTIDGLVGKPFAKPIQLGDDMPSPLVEFAEDVDGQGNHLDVFARKSFEKGLAKGLVHILVEYPAISPDDAPQTLADERVMANQPYWVMVDPEEVIAAYSEQVGGIEKLTHVRIRECSIERVGWEEVEIQRVRVLEPGTWALWRKADKKDEWSLEAEGTTTLDYIPMVTWYAGERTSCCCAAPPLLDLAHLNVAHWQSASDQRNVLTVARFPILAASGVSEDEANKVIGPNKFLTSMDAQSKWYYVEHTGAAIEAGRQDLEDLKEEMATMGIELLMRKPGNTTATAKAVDSAENNSTLQALAGTFKDVLERAFEITAEWMGKGIASGSLEVNKDFGLKMSEATDLSALQDARRRGDISREAFINELKRRGTLCDDYDPEEDLKLVEVEHDKAMADEALRFQLQNEGKIGGNQPKEKANEDQ